MGWEEIAIGRADMAGWRDTRASPQNKPVAHEFAVVLADGPWRGTEPWIRQIGAGSPLPHITENLLHPFALRWLWMKKIVLQQGSPHRHAFSGELPLLLRGKAITLPPGIGVCLEEANVANRFREI